MERTFRVKKHEKTKEKKGKMVRSCNQANKSTILGADTIRLELDQ